MFLIRVPREEHRRARARMHASRARAHEFGLNMETASSSATRSGEHWHSLPSGCNIAIRRCPLACAESYWTRHCTLGKEIKVHSSTHWQTVNIDKRGKPWTTQLSRAAVRWMKNTNIDLPPSMLRVWWKRKKYVGKWGNALRGVQFE